MLPIGFLPLADRFFAVALYGREAILSCIRDDVAVCGACVVEGSPYVTIPGRTGFILLAPVQDTCGCCQRNYVKQILFHDIQFLGIHIIAAHKVN